MQIFISYKSEDRKFANQLREKLLSWGHTCWLDAVDIKAGSDWIRAIHEGLKVSEIVIGVMTPQSLASKHVVGEWGYAIDNDKKLILLLLRDIDSAEIPSTFSNLQRIDFRKNKRAGFVKLRQTLLEIPYLKPMPMASATLDQNKGTYYLFAGIASILLLLAIAFGLNNLFNQDKNDLDSEPIATSGANSNISCEGIPQSKLAIGQTAIIASPGTGLHLYETYSVSSMEVADVFNGETVITIEGAICAESAYWWKVLYRDSVEGWTPEVVGEEYFLEGQVN